MNKKFAKHILVAALASIALGSVAPANAALINSLFIQGENTVSDFDAERVMRNGAVVTSGAFQVNDVIQAVLRFTDTNNNIISDTLASPYQFNAYAELKIAAIVDTGLNVAGNELYRLIFTPTGNLGANVFTELYERTASGTNPFASTTTPGAAIALIQAQTLIAEFGLGELDDFWGSTVINNIGAIAGATAGSAQSPNGEFGLSVLSNAGGLPIGPNGILSGTDGNFHDVVGSSSIYKRNSGVNTGWLVSSNTEVRFNNVPEPGTIAVMGLGLMGLAFARRRRSV